MAFKKIEITDGKVPSNLDGIFFNVNNGDLQALQQIKEKWSFKTEADALRFALAVMRQSEKEVVYIDKDGTKFGLVPGEELTDKKK